MGLKALLQVAAVDITGSVKAGDIGFRVAPRINAAGRMDEAATLYSTLTARNPQHENAWFRLGGLQLEREDFRSAAESFRNCLRKRASWTEAEVNLGLAYWKLGQHAQCREVLEKLVAREPDCKEAVRGLAANSLDEEDMEGALKWHHRLQQLGDSSPEVLHNTGLLLHRAGQLEAAIESYQAAVIAKPDFAEAMLNLGHVLQSAGREMEARESWSKALELRPEFAQGYFLPRV